MKTEPIQRGPKGFILMEPGNIIQVLLEDNIVIQLVCDNVGRKMSASFVFYVFVTRICSRATPFAFFFRERRQPRTNPCDIISVNLYKERPSRMYFTTRPPRPLEYTVMTIGYALSLLLYS